MKILFVSGYLERVGDDSAFWEIADRAEGMGHEVTRRQWDTLHPDDIAGHEAVVTYSYGQAALWHALGALPVVTRVALSIKLLIIITGVPRFLWAQFYGSPWTITGTFQRAIAFNLHGAIPASAGIHNATAPDVPLSNLSAAPATERMNVTCDGEGVNHASIQAVPAVQDAVIAALESIDA